MASQSVIKTGEVRPGQGFPKKAIAWLNGLLADMRAIEPKEGANVTLRRFNDGTEISAKNNGSGGGGGSPKTLYFVEDGVLYTGTFSVSDITAV